MSAAILPDRQRILFIYKKLIMTLPGGHVINFTPTKKYRSPLGRKNSVASLSVFLCQAYGRFSFPQIESISNLACAASLNWRLIKFAG